MTSVIDHDAAHSERMERFERIEAMTNELMRRVEQTEWRRAGRARTLTVITGGAS